MPRVDHLNHVPDAAAIGQIEDLRRMIIQLDEKIHEVVPASRERALALTKLEETRMWAVKGLVMPFPAQEV